MNLNGKSIEILFVVPQQCCETALLWNNMQNLHWLDHSQPMSWILGKECMDFTSWHFVGCCEVPLVIRKQPDMHECHVHQTSVYICIYMIGKYNNQITSQISIYPSYYPRKLTPCDLKSNSSTNAVHYLFVNDILLIVNDICWDKQNLLIFIMGIIFNGDLGPGSDRFT